MARLFKCLVFAFALVLLAASALAVSVNRAVPLRVSPGEQVDVSFSASSVAPGKLFTLEDDLPDSWKFESWEVSGSKEEKQAIKHQVIAGNKHGWSFTAGSSTAGGSDVTVKYAVIAPDVEGSYEFDAVWFDPSGFGNDKRSVTVRKIRCGDSVCEGSENNNVCPADCPAPEAPVPSAGGGALSSAPVAAPSGAGIGNFGLGLLIALVVAGVGIGAFLMVKKRR